MDIMSDDVIRQVIESMLRGFEAVFSGQWSNTQY